MYKLENTSANKAKFFALYWGVKCLRNVLINDRIPPLKVEVFKANEYEYLELTPLSQIRDEVAEVVGQWLFDAGYRTTSYNGDIAVLGKGFVVQQSNPLHLPSIVVDFLRSRGYYVGDGTEIEYGWVKLKK